MEARAPPRGPHRVARLEEETKQAASARWEMNAASRGGGGASFQHHLAGDEVVKLRMVGRDAAFVHVTTVVGSAPHAPARLMGALRSLDLQLQHACVSRVQGVTVPSTSSPPSLVTECAAARAALPCAAAPEDLMLSCIIVMLCLLTGLQHFSCQSNSFPVVAFDPSMAQFDASISIKQNHTNVMDQWFLLK